MIPYIAAIRQALIAAADEELALLRLHNALAATIGKSEETVSNVRAWAWALAQTTLRNNSEIYPGLISEVAAHVAYGYDLEEAKHRAKSLMDL